MFRVLYRECGVPDSSPHQAMKFTQGRCDWHSWIFSNERFPPSLVCMTHEPSISFCGSSETDYPWGPWDRERKSLIKQDLHHQVTLPARRDFQSLSPFILQLSQLSHQETEYSRVGQASGGNEETSTPLSSPIHKSNLCNFGALTLLHPN